MKLSCFTPFYLYINIHFYSKLYKRQSLVADYFARNTLALCITRLIHFRTTGFGNVALLLWVVLIGDMRAFYITKSLLFILLVMRYALVAHCFAGDTLALSVTRSPTAHPRVANRLLTSPLARTVRSVKLSGVCSCHPCEYSFAREPVFPTKSLGLCGGPLIVGIYFSATNEV